MKTILLTTLTTVLLPIGCGTEKFKKSSGPDSIPTIENNHPDQTNLNQTDKIEFTGYVANAFEVSVDGNVYSDLEDFYTEELARLPQKVQEAGYGDTYEINFDAKIGFEDLWQGMIVYIGAVSDRGYQGTGRVTRGGEFAIEMPKRAIEEVYKVRANKRINVILTSESEIINICYNFSAIEQSVLFSESEKPIILKDFVTKITAYACSDQKDSGIAIPKAVTKEDSAESKIKIAPGMSKADLIKHYTADEMFIKSASKWCWYSDTKNTAAMCAINNNKPCQCFVEFDERGVVNNQNNIKSEFLDLKLWQ